MFLVSSMLHILDSDLNNGSKKKKYLKVEFWINSLSPPNYNGSWKLSIYTMA
jgi:hypothetical protein